MNKKLLLIPVLLTCTILSACSPSIKESTSEFILPQDLQEAGCRVIDMEGGHISDNHIYLIKCPQGYIGTSFRVDHGKFQSHGTVQID